jgi:hypothetical protein
MYPVFDLQTGPLSIHHVGLGLGLGRIDLIRTMEGFIENIVFYMYQGGRGFKQKTVDQSITAVYYEETR